MSGETPYAAGQRAQAAVFNEHLAQPYSALTLQNGWTQLSGAVNAQCRLLNQVTLEIIGALTVGTNSTGVVIAQIPNSLWYPVSSQAIPWVQWGAPVGTPYAGMLNITAAGQLKAYNLPPSGTFTIAFHGTVSLDA